MRSIKHWTPRYIAARLREMIYQRRNSDLPWLTQDANRFLQTYLLRSDSGVEFGSGRSTLWLASRVGRLVSLEHDRDWYKRVSEALAQEQVLNVDYRYLAGDMNDMNGMEEAICRITDGLPSAQFDFNRHLPSISMSPESRSLEFGPDGLLWDEIARTIKPWRHYWTSSGVTDTAFYFKPVDA